MTANEYPGNPSLAPEVRERVLSTFSQTLSLFDEGQLDEVVAGCDLILEMDDRFEPARKLRQKAKDPASPVDLSAFYNLSGSASATVDSSVPTGDSDALILDAVEKLNAGQYESAIEVCNSVLAADPANEEAQRIGQQANERLEADPFVRQFVQEAEAFIGRGDVDSARTLIEKARSLDPLHPAITAVMSKAEAATAAPAAPHGGGGFEFGTDSSSPFAGAFGETQAPSSGLESNAAATPEEPASPPPATFDFATPGKQEPASPAESTSPSGEATNFGFTLEEEPEPVAEPEPAPDMISGEAQTFDFSAGDVEVSADDQQKIANYLSDGDELFESGDYQGSIDAWSKIFLIDVTNEQASERIETAKEKKREADQKLDDLVTTGVAAYDRGDYHTARATFEEVLAQDANNFRAGEYLEKLDDHSAATAGGAAAGSIPPPSPSPTLDDGDSLYPGDMYEGDTPAPPPPPVARGSKTAGTTKPMAAKGSPKGLILAVVAVVVLAVAGWFGWSMMSGGDAPQTDSTITQGKINRARVLAEGGDYAQAIDVLSSVEHGDPMREQALQLIAQYRQRQAETGGTVGGRPMNEVREELLASARESFAADDFMDAKATFEEAAKLKALDGSDRQMYEAASRQVSKLDSATALFAQGSYQEAIQELSTILEEEPDNVNAGEMLTNAHFNLGVNALKGRNTEEAVARFTLVLEQNPGDAMARRSLEIAQLYEDRQKDLMYEIFVKYLPQR